MKPVYVNSGGTLDLKCELDFPFNLQWHRALFQDDDWPARRRVYEKIDATSENGFFTTAHIIDGRGTTELRKFNVSVTDAGSYKCSRTSDPQTSYAVDVNVLQGECDRRMDRPTLRHTYTLRQTHTDACCCHCQSIISMMILHSTAQPSITKWQNGSHDFTRSPILGTSGPTHKS